jgi:micrococcal nuclease
VYEYDARFVRVIDGDTVDLVIDLGLDVQLTIRVRLAGVNCPERSAGAPWRLASEFTQEWLVAAGASVSIRTVKDRREKYGRYLAWVYPRGGFDQPTLNQRLLDSGHAVPMGGSIPVGLTG